MFEWMGHVRDVGADGQLMSQNDLDVRYVVRVGNKLAEDRVQW
jgi:hypothetical protein